MTNTSKLAIPDGWTIRPMGQHGDQAIIQSSGPHAGMVTVDFERRVFRGGHSTAGRGHGPNEKPVGRGWNQKLVDEAVKWLRDALS